MRDIKQYNYSHLTYAGEPSNVSGCGWCSVADFLDKYPPEDICRWMDGRCTESRHGTLWSGIVTGLRHFGVNATMYGSGLLGCYDNINFDLWKKDIKNGKCGILLMGNSGVGYRWTGVGHYIAIENYDEITDTYYVADPASNERTGWHSWNDFVPNIKVLYTVDVCYKERDRFMFDVSIIKHGSYGVDVLLLQEILKSRGLYEGDLDRSFGDKTEEALNTYKKMRGRTPNGICDFDMWSDLLGKVY